MHSIFYKGQRVPLVPRGGVSWRHPLWLIRASGLTARCDHSLGRAYCARFVTRSRGVANTSLIFAEVFVLYIVLHSSRRRVKGKQANNTRRRPRHSAAPLRCCPAGADTGYYHATKKSVSSPSRGFKKPRNVRSFSECIASICTLLCRSRCRLGPYFGADNPITKSLSVGDGCDANKTRVCEDLAHHGASLGECRGREAEMLQSMPAEKGRPRKLPRGGGRRCLARHVPRRAGMIVREMTK